MQWFVIAITLVATLSPAIWFQCYPVWQGSFLFTVRVPAGFAQTAAGQQIIRGFLWSLWTSCSLSAGVLTFSLLNRHAGLTVAALAFHIAGLIAPYFWAYWRTKRHAAPAGGAIRQATLLADDDPPTPFWITAAPLLSLTLLVAAAIALSLLWDQIPDPMPLHYGLDGQPDRWGPKRWSNVYGILPAALATQLLLAFLLYAIGHSGRATPQRHLNQTSLAVAMLTVAATMGFILLLPILRQYGLPSALAIATPVVTIVGPMLLVTRKLQGVNLEEGEPTSDEHWRAGLLYSDPADARLVVPNRLNAGYTPNLGHPVMRIAFPLLVAATLASAFAPALFR